MVIGFFFSKDNPTDVLSIQERLQECCAWSPWAEVVGRVSGQGGLDHMVSRAVVGVCRHHALDQGLHRCHRQTSYPSSHDRESFESTASHQTLGI